MSCKVPFVTTSPIDSSAMESDESDSKATTTELKFESAAPALVEDHNLKFVFEIVSVSEGFSVLSHLFKS